LLPVTSKAEKVSLLNEPWMYIVLLGLVCIVISFFAPRSVTNNSVNMVKEIEDTMEHFANEIEEENNQLLQTVAQIKTDHEQQMNRLFAKVDQLEKQNYDLSNEIKGIVMNKLHELNKQPSNVQVVELVPEIEKVVTPLQMKERYSELFLLHEQGKAVEYIAKKLKLNKGEVQLIIQLAKQEEQNRV
jgi:septal ring factor EnvC (AmiA/AmiB activator)